MLSVPITSRHSVGIRCWQDGNSVSRDTENSPKVAILNETFARFLFENGDPIGRHVHLGSNDSDVEIVA